MKEMLQRYASYHVWANHKFLFALEPLTHADWFRDVPNSFNSLYKTIFHMWDAESLWWQRVHQHESFIRPSDTFDPTPKELGNGLLQQSLQWEAYVKSPALDNEALLSMLYYKNMKGEPFESSVCDILLHLFNHGTYHRGQLVTMMHQLKLEHIPNSDFIAYMRTT